MPEQNSDCDYRKTCYFFNVKPITPEIKKFRETYCIKRPKKCAIYQTRAKRNTPMCEAEILRLAQDLLNREV